MLWDPLKYSRLILNNEMYLKLNILRTQVNTVHCTQTSNTHQIAKGELNRRRGQ